MRIKLPSATDLALFIEAIDALDSGISIFDADLRLVAGNRWFAEILGFPDALRQPGTPLETLFRFNAERGEYGPGDIDALVQERLDLARRFEAHHFERIRPDGTVIEIRGTPLAQGGFVTIYTDVTEDRRREWALKELSEKLEQRVTARTAELAEKTRQLQLVMDHIRQGITLIGPDLRLELCNRQFLGIMDFPESFALPGKPFADFIRFNAERGDYGAVDIEATVAERLQQAQHPVPHHFERTRADGRTIEIIGDPTGDGGFVTTYLDVSERKAAEERLRQSESRFRDFAAASSDWLFETDAEFRFTFVTERFYELTGWPEDSMLGKTRMELAVVAHREEHTRHWAEHLALLDAHRAFRDFEYPLHRADGSLCHIRVSGTPCFDAGGRFTGYRGCGSDVTLEHAAEEALRSSVSQLHAILEASPVGVALVSRQDLTIHFCNSRLTELLGMNGASLVGHPPCDACRALLDSLPREGRISDQEIRMQRLDGSEWWGLISARPVSYAGQPANLVWVYDVSELHNAREQLRQMALHDPLTGLPNRRFFEQAAAQALARASRQDERGALIFLDLDGFKSVNDRHGHQRGDSLLRAIATRLQERLRKADFVARLGGDEFAVIAEPRQGGDSTERFARELIALISETARSVVPDCSVSASAGIAYFDTHGPDFDTLLRRADTAMYQAKDAGRAAVCIAQESPAD